MIDPEVEAAFNDCIRILDNMRQKTKAGFVLIALQPQKDNPSNAHPYMTTSLHPDDLNKVLTYMLHSQPVRESESDIVKS